MRSELAPQLDRPDSLRIEVAAVLARLLTWTLGTGAAVVAMWLGSALLAPGNAAAANVTPSAASNLGVARTAASVSLAGAPGPSRPKGPSPGGDGNPAGCWAKRAPGPTIIRCVGPKSITLGGYTVTSRRKLGTVRILINPRTGEIRAELKGKGTIKRGKVVVADLTSFHGKASVIRRNKAVKTVARVEGKGMVSDGEGKTRRSDDTDGVVEMELAS